MHNLQYMHELVLCMLHMNYIVYVMVSDVLPLVNLSASKLLLVLLKVFSCM